MAGGRGKRKRKQMFRGEVVYVAAAFYKGKKKVRHCATEAESRRVERELYEQLKAEVDGQHQGGGEEDASLDGPVSVARALFDHADITEADLNKSKQSAKRLRQVARLLVADYRPLAALPISQLTLKHLEALRDARVRDLKANSTINRDLKDIRSAVKRLRPDFKVPSKLFLHEDNLHVDSLSPEEFAAMTAEGAPPKMGKRGAAWNPTTPMYWPFCAMENLYAITGLRLSEVSQLRREAVNFRLAELRVTVKGGRMERVALGQRALAILREACDRQDTPFVFPNLRTRLPYSANSVGDMHRRRARAVMPDRRFRLHDTRHHAATMALEAGASLPKLQQWLRLKSPSMVQRYARFEPEGQRALSDAVAGLMSASASDGTGSRRGFQTSRRG